MPGHVPELNADSLRKLRKLVGAIQANSGKGLPMSQLVALSRDLKFESGLTIDFNATAEIGSPMVVLRIPTEPADLDVFDKLTRREREVAHLVATGLSNAEIADCLCISVHTVKDHVHNILDKSGLSSRTQIAAALNGHSPAPAR